MQSSIAREINGLTPPMSAPHSKMKESLCGRISNWAFSDPSRLAIVDGESRLTYKELDDRSNQLARRLVSLGLQAENCVALLLERSADFLISALGVLKAGGAYLPLDSSVPAERATHILRDADARILITHRSKSSRLSGGAYRIVDLDGADRPVIDAESTQPVAVEVSTDRLAYVVYTSGSTGRPKGVEITHGNLLNLIAWHQHALDVTAEDRASQVAGLGFDAAGWEIWPHLTAGASVHIADDATRRSPQRLRDWLLSERITISFVPTVLAEQMLHLNWPTDAALRILLTGADTLRRRPVDGLPFVFVNNYGPTECTVVATSGVVLPDEANHSTSHRTPSIGRPIPGASVFILDNALRPVSAGEPGELCIGGALVGRGYRYNPEMTSDRFVHYTAPNGQVMRIYRTGDQARLLPNGEIAFLGRVDDQVKIRGYRVELGEIVATLDRYPGVEASTVVVRDAQTNPALAAYIVPAPGALLQDQDIRAFLAARLPDYMIPSQFVAIASLPMTANGKLDSAALPAPDQSNLIRNASSAAGAPSTLPAGESSNVEGNNLTARIGAIVAELLGQPSVSKTDNFFMIGGHSMLGVQLVARIRDAFSVKLTLRQLFGAPTISALAAEVEKLCAQLKGTATEAGGR